MKKRLHVFIILLFSSMELFAENSFFIEPYSGFVYGAMNKYIFSTREENMLSCLEWETKPLFYFGLKAGFENEFYGGYIAHDMAIPRNSGKMYDSDFYYDSQYPNGNKCNYTIHDNEALKNLNTEVGFFFKKKLTDKSTLKPTCQLQYTYDSFVSKNGYGWYGRDSYSTTGNNESWDSPYAKKVKVLGVEYYRHTFYSWLGLDLVIVPSNFREKNLNFTFGFLLSPFTYTSSMDHHLSKVGNDYHQQEIEYSYLDRIKLNAKVGYKINRRFSLNMGVSLVHGTLEKGDTYSDKNNSKGMEKITQKTGADIFQSRMEFSCRISL